MPKEKAQFLDNKRRDWVRHNEQIRLPQVVVIQDGVNLGLMYTRDAIALARNAGLDLVEVASNERPPVCRIMEYGKFMFDKSKKEKTRSAGTKEKEISFRYVIEEHDLETKVEQARKFLQKGFKVKLVVKFKHREKAHKDQGFNTLNRMVTMLSDIASIEKPPGFEGVNVTARLDLKKELKDKKPQ